MKQIKINNLVLNRVKLKEIKEQAIQLWKNSFKEDTIEFATNYMNKYTRFCEKFFYVDQNGKLVLMGFAAIEKIKIDGLYRSCCLIEGISVDKEFQGKGIMSEFMNFFTEYLLNKYDVVLIQAYKWEIYRKYQFDRIASYDVYSFTSNSNYHSSVSIKKKNAFDVIGGDIKRSFFHKRLYNRMMSMGQVTKYSSKNAWVVIDESLGVISYKYSQSFTEVTDLLKSINLSCNIRVYGNDIVKDPAFALVEKGVLETKGKSKKINIAGKNINYGFFF
jgi:hypothetical protein